MDTTPPIACSLSPAELPQRRAEAAVLGRELIAVERGERSATLRFAAGEETRRRIEEFVDKESQCCGFFRFEIEGTTLRIATPEGGEQLLRDLTEQIRPAA
jgi:hypothetical protein